MVIYAGSSAFRGEVEQRAGVALGREFKIGDLQINWSWAPRIQLRDVLIGGAAEDAPPLLEAAAIDLRIRLLPLLRGDVVLPHLQLEQPKLALHVDEKGVPNWSFSKNPAAATAAEVATPDERGEAPVIGELVIKDGHFKYDDDAKDLQLEGDISTATGEAEKTESVKFDAKGKLQGKAMKVTFVGGSILALRDSETPYPLDLSASYGGTEVTVKGTATDPFKLEAANIDLTLKGPDLSEIFPLLGVPAPPTPPYNLKGNLVREGETWHFTKMHGRIGDSDVAGEVKIDYGPEKPVLTANLVSDNLDFDDLAPLVGAPPDTDETASAEQKKVAAQLEQKDELFPDVPLNVNLLDVMDMEVKLDAKKVRAENYLPVEALAGTVTVRGGKAVVKPLKIAVRRRQPGRRAVVGFEPQAGGCGGRHQAAQRRPQGVLQGQPVLRDDRGQDRRRPRYQRPGQVIGRGDGHGRWQDLLHHDRRRIEWPADRSGGSRYRGSAGALYRR